MAKKKILEKFKPWIEVRRRFHPFDAHIQMARELGLNPKKFDGVANAKHKPWKLPLPEFIEELYFRHFKKRRPENVWSIEQIVRDANRKKAERKARKQASDVAYCSGPLRKAPAIHPAVYSFIRSFSVTPSAFAISWRVFTLGFWFTPDSSFVSVL
jgi:hypothetical protein